MLLFLTSGFGLQPPVLHNPVSPSHAPLLLLCLVLVLLNFETSRTQGSIIQSHFQLLLGSSGPFPPRSPCMGVSDRLLPVPGTAVSPASSAPCHQHAGFQFWAAWNNTSMPWKAVGKQQRTRWSFIFLSCFDNLWQESR